MQKYREEIGIVYGRKSPEKYLGFAWVSGQEGIINMRHPLAKFEFYLCS